MRRSLAVIIALVSFALGVGAMVWWNARHRTTINQEVVAAKAAADTARQKADTAATHLDAAIDTVRQTITRVRVDTFVVHPTTHDDTTHAVEQLASLVVEHARLQQRAAALADSAVMFKLAALERFRADSVVIDRLTAQVETTPRASRWHVGVVSGYGPSLDTQTGRIHNGPFVGVGASYSVF